MTSQLIPLISPPPDHGWTALRNFAHLRGQFRVSLTPKCNVACWFCHNEGDVPPPLTRINRSARPRPGELDAAGFITIMRELIGAGLRRVYFTGGDPLLSPIAHDVLTRLPVREPDVSYTLITNGTLIRANEDWLPYTGLDKVKVSLHYFSDDTFRAIAGTRMSLDVVLDGIDAARGMFPAVELNTLMQKENEHELTRILDFALDRRMPVQFIELVETEHNTSRKSSAISADGIIRHLRTLTRHERVEAYGVGQGRRIFTVDDVEIDVIHRDLGRHHVGQCGTCSLRPKCIEGFWALRLDHAGGLQPCLLRDDLRLSLLPLLDTPERIPDAVAAHVAAFTEGTL
ncbi:radical SAM protein [Streptomyces sp. NPDC001549]|uniref:radical SAM protein n=1 Tax=Streptomyces sp. NPDC001549 TaxID=3364586 RepID=UPI0036B8F3CE